MNARCVGGQHRRLRLINSIARAFFLCFFIVALTSEGAFCQVAILGSWVNGTTQLTASRNEAAATSYNSFAFDSGAGAFTLSGGGTTGDNNTSASSTGVISGTDGIIKTGAFTLTGAPLFLLVVPRPGLSIINHSKNRGTHA